MAKKYSKMLIFLLLAGLMLVLNAVFGWSDALQDPQYSESLRQTLESNQMAAFWMYIGISVVGCVLLALPGVVFAVVAGVLFGPVLGTVACCLAATLGASLSFLVGRYFLRDAIRPLVMKNRHIRRLLFEDGGNNMVFVLLITRMVPLFPFNLQNFAYGITDIRFWPYTLYSFLFMLPGTAVYTLAAAGVAEGRNRWLYLAAAAVLAVVVTAVSMRLRKTHGQTTQKRENRDRQ